MLTDIMRQPAVLTELLARRAEFLDVGQAGLVPGSRGQLYGFGCGDGWFAARAIAAVSQSRFGRTLAARTSLQMLLEPQPAFGPDDRGVAVSMSGSVDRTNEAALALAASGGHCVALTNETGGQLGQIAGQVASLRVPDVAPFLTGTARYSATLLGLMMLLDGASGTDATASTAMLEFLDGGLQASLAVAQQTSTVYCQELAEDGIGGVRVLGAGADWPTADYGAAKLVKLIEAPVWSGEIEEFAHSQFWSARRDELVILLAGSRAAALLAENTAQALRAAGMRCLAVETAGAAVPSAAYRITLPAVAPWLSPLAVAAPLQVLAYALAVALGGDPDASQDSQDPDRFRAAQMLSRRCELSPVC